MKKFASGIGLLSGLGFRVWDLWHGIGLQGFRDFYGFGLRGLRGFRAVRKKYILQLS